MGRLALLVVLFVLAAAPPARAGEIVVLKPATSAVATETAEREAELGFDADRRFTRAVRGFAAELTADQVAELRADPEVAMVVPDRPVQARAAVPARAGERVPVGARRATAAPAGTVREAASGAVAVLDSGVDLDHPNLDVVAGANCVAPGAPPDDDNGHGTHVAGTVGARNTGAGVTGVAPGTRIVAVKVLDSGGSGTTSSVLCGIDYVLANAARLGIGVVNFSLGGVGRPSTCATDPEHAAFCALTRAGITPVVAAGNDGWDFGTSEPDAPAAFAEVLTVAAMVDTDGLPGARGGACDNGDDVHASFSNYATDPAERAHLVAAPGACILSTARGGGTAWMSGTSMAAPHVAALVALCRGEAGTPGPCAGLRPDQVITHMRATATINAFTGRAGRDYGPLAQLSAAAPAPAVTEQPAPELPAPGETGTPPADQPVAQPEAGRPTPTPTPTPTATPSTPTSTPTSTPAPGAPAAPAPWAPTTPAPLAPVTAPRPTRPAPPVTSTAGRRPTLTLGRTTLAGLARRGLTARVRCADPARPCTATVRLRSAGRTLSTKRGTRVTLRPGRRLALRRVARAYEVVADVRQGARTVRVTKRLTLTR